ncbi:hypothetical protein GIB67_024961 [Kingdonia uniflora]|uniref:Uncharacterized protein n=1 Tax=Kingdonia uniflora TaxID=39325 RepID=A0A7J7NYT0_9MAGN|nr:hypothetical protein GIB67_024961 [Kingdonia uniflora]
MRDDRGEARQGSASKGKDWVKSIEDLNAFKSLKTGGVGNLLSPRKLKEHYSYKLEKVLSDGTAAAAKKKKGLTHHEHASLSPNAYGTMQTRGKSGGFDQQITVLNNQLYKLKEDKEEFEPNINLREALKEKTSECDLLKETIEQMMEEIELKHVVDEQCALEFADLPRQLDAKSAKIWRKKNTSLKAELWQKSGLEDCNQSLFVEMNKKCKESESLKAVNALLIEQIDLQRPPATPPVPDTTLTKKYEDLLAVHEDVKKKLIAKENL